MVGHLTKVKEGRVLPAASTFIASLKACGNVKDLKFGIEIHAEVSRKSLLNTDLFVGSALVDMYAKCGELAKAREVFDVLQLRDVVTWTALISGYAHHEHGEEALHYFEQMQFEGILPNAVTFVCSLKACGNIRAFHKGRNIHVMVSTTTMLHGHLLLGSTLVNMYARCGFLAIAHEVFDALPVKDVVTWTALIAGYAQHGYGEEALKCLDQMQVQGVSPNAITYVCSLTACGDVVSFLNAREIHFDMERRGLLRTNLFVGNSLVDVYCKCGMIAKAQEVFDELLIHDVVTWNALIAGYANHDHGEEALDCFKQMHLECVIPDAITFTCSLKACGSTGAMTKGREIHAEIVRRGMLANNIILGSALIDMYAKCGLVVRALDIFDSMKARDQATWGALIAGYAQLGDIERVVHWLDRMSEDTEPSSVIFVSVLNACSHAGLVENGIAYFMAMSDDYGIAPTLEHHTCLVDLLGRAGQLGGAFSTTFKTPFHPDSVLWLSVLGSCRKWCDLALGKHAFQQVLVLNEKEAAACISMSNIYIEDTGG